MYLGVEQWFAGLCFPDTPKELCLLQGPRSGSLFPSSCHMWGSGEPGSGSFRRQHAMMPSPRFLLSAAVFVGVSSKPGLCHTPRNPLLVQECSPEGMQMTQSSLTAAVPSPVAAGTCPWVLDVGAKLPFSSFGSSSHKRQGSHSPSTMFMALSPGHVTSPGCLEKGQWK